MFLYCRTVNFLVVVLAVLLWVTYAGVHATELDEQKQPVDKQKQPAVEQTQPAVEQTQPAVTDTCQVLGLHFKTVAMAEEDMTCFDACLVRKNQARAEFLFYQEFAKAGLGEKCTPQLDDMCTFFEAKDLGPSPTSSIEKATKAFRDNLKKGAKNVFQKGISNLCRSSSSSWKQALTISPNSLSSLQKGLGDALNAICDIADKLSPEVRSMPEWQQTEWQQPKKPEQKKGGMCQCDLWLTPPRVFRSGPPLSLQSQDCSPAEIGKRISPSGWQFVGHMVFQDELSCFLQDVECVCKDISVKIKQRWFTSETRGTYLSCRPTTAVGTSASSKAVGETSGSDGPSDVFRKLELI
ncbi:hypothetical protein BCR37DRAFT_382882 [Protomyces lactucae-debilis]|uniref:Uncharacterized protein n=1 Tax=Protomyces lactucae-debilis TaxID=2754530 RepID=A0A1Y2F0E5_PROLT|nr:uncharacterized protein BCR37DRAFT_382882 [Protomyces lactucae-debilis]ORY77371.1 hypothetical protein BCR37DRAFT_382882 [Protomyces lactucae-debilis]